ncbi:hypothetical protein M405DRAFT_824019, partial [Rhizopogon salebrosus TDB-379]
ECNENLCAEFIARMAQYDLTERDLHGFCGFVVVLKFLIFTIIIFFMTLLLLFNLDVIFTTGIKVAVVIKQAFVFLIDILSAGGVTPLLPLIETKNPQMLEAN